MRLPRRRTFCLLVLAAYLAWALLRPMPTLLASASLPNLKPSPAKLAWPTSAQAALGAVGFGVLETHGKQKAVPTASTAKLLSALTILKQKPLAKASSTPTISLGLSDVAIYKKYLAEDGSVLPIKAGEQLSEYQALQAMLLPSANNIADSTAIWAFGSMNNFLESANNYAKQLGLSSTHIVDASGFSPRSVSTASDLTKLGLAAMQNPLIAQIVATRQISLPGEPRVNNVNWLLGIDGIDGIKTGNTDQAGGCFVFSAIHQIDGKSVKVVGAVMGAPNLQMALTSSHTLLESAYGNFAVLTGLKAGQVVGYYQSAWGAKISIVTNQPLSSLVWAPQPGSLSANFKKIPADSTTGYSAGQVSWTVGSHTIADNLTTAAPLAPPSVLWRLGHIY